MLIVLELPLVNVAAQQPICKHAMTLFDEIIGNECTRRVYQGQVQRIVRCLVGLETAWATLTR